MASCSSLAMQHTICRPLLPSNRECQKRCNRRGVAASGTYGGDVTVRMCQCRSAICLWAADNGIVPCHFDLLVILKACRYSTDVSVHLVSDFTVPIMKTKLRFYLQRPLVQVGLVVKESQVKKFVMSKSYDTSCAMCIFAGPTRQLFCWRARK